MRKQFLKIDSVGKFQYEVKTNRLRLSAAAMEALCVYMSSTLEGGKSGRIYSCFSIRLSDHVKL